MASYPQRQRPNARKMIRRFGNGLTANVRVYAETSSFTGAGVTRTATEHPGVLAAVVPLKPDSFEGQLSTDECLYLCGEDLGATDLASVGRASVVLSTGSDEIPIVEPIVAYRPDGGVPAYWEVTLRRGAWAS